MTTFYLITHAHTQADPCLDARKWQLSPHGVGQVARLAAQPWWQSVARVALSSEAKTRQTVAPILTRRALPVTVDARLDELQRTGWTDDYAAHVRRTFAMPDQAQDGWEAAVMALARVRTAVADLARRHPDDVVAVVSHGLILSLYRAHLLGATRVDFEDWRRLSFAAVAQVQYCPHGGAETLIADFEPVGQHHPRA